MTKKLAVIGAGPKGTAIAVKAAALRQVGHTPPDVVIYEHDTPGAAWTGRSGYTDGEQPLCTLAERDLGFPYDRQSFWTKGPELAEALFARFSWQAFSVRHGSGGAEYSKWVMRGRHPPSHRDFALYLNTAVANSGAFHIKEQVVEIDFDAAQQLWRVTSRGVSGPRGMTGSMVSS